MTDRKNTDRKMLETVEALLTLPDDELNLTPQYTRQVLTRLHELLPRPRPAHRPVDDTGEFVARLVILGREPDAAIRVVAKNRRKTEGAVKQAYGRFIDRRSKLAAAAKRVAERQK